MASNGPSDIPKVSIRPYLPFAERVRCPEVEAAPMDPALLKAIQKNCSRTLGAFLELQSGDGALDGTYLGLNAVQLLCMSGSWECVVELFRFYRKIGMCRVLRHAEAFASLWRRGYRDPLHALVRIGLDPRLFLEMITCEADFEGLLRCVRNRSQFIRDFQRVVCRRRLPCPWLSKYLALLAMQAPCHKN